MVLLDTVSYRFGGSCIPCQGLENAVHRDWGACNTDDVWLVVSLTIWISLCTKGREQGKSIKQHLGRHEIMYFV